MKEHRRRLILLAVAAATFIIAALLVASHWAPLGLLDRWFIAFVSSVRAEPLTAFMRGVTAFGGVTGVSLFTTVLVLGLWWKGRSDSAVISAALVTGGTGLNSLAKMVVARPRPDQAAALIELPGSSGFPSGHTMGSLCLAFAVWWTVGRCVESRRARLALRTLCVAYAASVAISRVYLGVHWPTDVVGAWLLGGSWIGAVMLMVRIHHPAFIDECAPQER